MILIEAMKKLKVIDKRILSNQQSIRKYASMPDTMRPYFGTEDKQKAEVKGLVQANGDLVEEYVLLKARIDATNLSTLVEVQGKKYTIASLLLYRRKLAEAMISTYKALDVRSRNSGMDFHSSSSDGKRVQILRFYDETWKNDGLRKWSDLYDAIDSKLEIVNATTDLIES